MYSGASRGLETCFFIKSRKTWDSCVFQELHENHEFYENDRNSRNSTNPGPQNLQNRAVIHTVSGVAARGGARNHNFHENSPESIEFHGIITVG